METLSTLGVALGLASLAGLNLYLVVFVTGLSIQQNWINVAQTYPELAVLGHPAIVIIAGVFYVLEFFADKVPWVDSLWDTIHTVVRPIGGAFLALHVLGTPDPVIDVIAALLAGSVTLLTHGMKAGTRLVANHSPEPFTNVALSVTEDVVVVGGLALIWKDPQLALIVFSVLLLAIAYFGPKLWRAVKVNAWLIWKKFSSPAVDHLETELPRTLPHELDITHVTVNMDREPIAWAVPCISTSAPGISANLFGYLVATESATPRLAFVAKRRFRHVAQEIPLDTYKLAHEPKFLSENVVLYSLEKKPRFTFVFARSQRPLVKALAVSLQDRLLTVRAQREIARETAATASV
jgi:hypothetical protein